MKKRKEDRKEEKEKGKRKRKKERGKGKRKRYKQDLIYFTEQERGMIIHYFSKEAGNERSP